ncbi:DNA recombination protein RmuC [Boudabousia marimammalium]|uniref:DNA recombination protein RmuC n=1 Tax=Boudabousia marimammalium TaxID=156892 RepID=A0A1Q5PRP5_9ACTO|nr:DNA recombination protein RmuC [Boudabousia marimammalium]OKL50258.1 hypothetical protein BM477_02385 [Boudabousia marimammalium]
MSYTELFFIFASLLLGLAIGYFLGSRSHGYSPTDSVQPPAATGQDMALLSQHLRQLEGRVQDLSNRTSQHFGSIGQQLRQAVEGDARLVEATRSLESTLSSHSARGAWGEIELHRIFEAAGLQQHVDYSLQAVQTDRSRPDAIIHLPESGSIVVDAKVPFDAYLRAMEVPADSAEYSQLMHAHANTLAEHVKTLQKRDYHSTISGSLGFTLMFLPMEALLSAALDVDPALLETSMRANVYIVTPTSLLATARTCAQIWLLAKTEDNARDIVKLGQELSGRIATAVNHLNRVGSSLQSALKAYNQTVGSLETRVLPQIRKIENLGEMPALNGVEDATARAFSSAEWGD